MLALLVALIATTWASDDLFRPTEAAPPGRDAALTAVGGLLGATSGEVDLEWLEAHVRPVRLPELPPRDWYIRLASALGPDGATGRALRRSPGPAIVVDGPSYTRVVLQGSPLLSIVCRLTPRGDTVIDEVSTTSCDLCSEPVRFVRDLLAEIQATGTAAGRLLPGIELSVVEALQQRGTSWLAVLQTRNQKGQELSRLLVGARAGPSQGNRIRVDYADGEADDWTVIWRHGSWQLDYDALPENSPLRLAGSEVNRWKDASRLKQSALERWRAPFSEVDQGTGLLVGSQAIGAHLDPRDGTLLVAVLGIDRILAGLIRIDLDTRQIIERIPLPSPSPQTPIDLGNWSSRWHFSVSADGAWAAVALPGRLWRIDLETQQAALLTSAGRITALHFAEPAVSDRSAPLVVGRAQSLTVYRSSGVSVHALDGTPRHIDSHQGVLAVATQEGHLEQITLGGTLMPPIPLCCGEGLADAALHPDGSEVLVACPNACRVAVARVHRIGSSTEVVDGAGAARPGTSWSTDGVYFTTPSQGESSHSLLLWRAFGDLPLARFGEPAPVHEISWSAHGRRIVTVGADGRVVVWDLDQVLHRGALNSVPSARPAEDQAR